MSDLQYVQKSESDNYSKEKCPEKKSLKIINFEQNENENELIISS